MEFTALHESVETMHVGTCPNRSYYIPENTEGTREGRYTLLNGVWDFKYWPSLAEAFRKEMPSLDEIDFDEIPVPSVWQTQGYDRNQYTNIKYPIPFDPPYVPEDNPCGLYVRRFTVTREEAGLKAYLNFEGVDSCLYLWVNDTFAGFSEVSHSTSEFDVTDLIREGDNTLCVLVLKWCLGTYFEDQDKLRMSGIFRDVYILYRPGEHIRDFFVKTPVAEDLAFARVTCELELEGAPSVTAALISPENELLEVKDASGNFVEFSLADPVLWNAEEPRQYTLVLSTPEERICQKVAVCRREIKNGVLYLNGKNIKFFGVNRHDSDPFVGYAVTRTEVMRDLILMKRHNINAIRTSHYPNAPFVPELAEEMGFYMIAEADNESHGCVSSRGAFDYGNGLYSELAMREEFAPVMLDRVQRCVERDKNRGCIVIWSLGNECGYGVNFEIAGRWVHERDNTRFTHYQGSYRAPKDRDNDFSMLDIWSTMYIDYPYIDEYCTNEANTRPFIQCEFSHAMGNGPGCIEGYMEQMEKYDRFAGGFVWEWCDHSVYMGKTPEGRGKYFYGGDFGEFPHDGNFCMDGLVYPDRTPHTGLLEYKNCIRPIRAAWGEDGSVILRSLRRFTSSKSFASVSYEVRKGGRAVYRGTWDVDLPPQGTVTVKPGCELPTEDATLVITYTAPEDTPFFEAGHVLGFDELRCPGNQPALEPMAEEGKARLTDTGLAFAISGDNFRYTLNKRTGLFAEMVCENRTLLTRPMELNLWRAPTDNDMYAKQAWYAVGYDRPTLRVYSIWGEERGRNAVVTCEIGVAAVSIAPFLRLAVTYTVNGKGEVEANVRAERDTAFPYLPRFGFRLFMPRAFDEVTYTGYGPYESYRDKHRASTYGIYTSSVADQLEDYIRPQENSSHWGCTEAVLAAEDMRLTVRFDAPFSFNVSQYTREELEHKQHNYELTPCGDTVLCLDWAQSGVGSGSCGPQLHEDMQVNETEFAFRMRLTPEGKK